MAGAGEGQAELKVGVGGRIRGGSIDGVAAIWKKKNMRFFVAQKYCWGEVGSKMSTRNSLWLLLLH